MTRTVLFFAVALCSVTAQAGTKTYRGNMTTRMGGLAGKVGGGDPSIDPVRVTMKTTGNKIRVKLVDLSPTNPESWNVTGKILSQRKTSAGTTIRAQFDGADYQRAVRKDAAASLQGFPIAITGAKNVATFTLSKSGLRYRGAVTLMTRLTTTGDSPVASAAKMLTPKMSFKQDATLK